jgi:hypothetical protein
MSDEEDTPRIAWRARQAIDWLLRSGLPIALVAEITDFNDDSVASLYPFHAPYACGCGWPSTHSGTCFFRNDNPLSNFGGLKDPLRGVNRPYRPPSFQRWLTKKLRGWEDARTRGIARAEELRELREARLRERNELRELREIRRAQLWVERQEARAKQREAREVREEAAASSRRKRVEDLSLGLPTPDAVPLPRKEHAVFYEAVLAATKDIPWRDLREDLVQELMVAGLAGWFRPEQLRQAVTRFKKRMQADNFKVTSLDAPLSSGDGDFTLGDLTSDRDSLWLRD